MDSKKNEKKNRDKAQNEQKEESVKAEETTSDRKEKSKKSFKAIAKRYWYWPVAVVVMGVIAVLWSYFMGYIGDTYKEKEAEIILDEEEANIYVGMYYKIGAHADGFAITYGIGEGSAEVEIDSFGVVHALQSGVRRIYVYAGNVRKSMRINVSEIRVVWQIGIGDEMREEDIIEAFSSVYDMSKSFEIEVTTLTALAMKENGDGYVAVAEGFEFFDVLLEDMYIGTFQVNIKDGLEEKDKVRTKDLVIRPEGLDFSTNVRKTEEDCSVGQTGRIDDFSFSTGGALRFISSKPETITVYQDGTYKIYRPGTATIAVICRAGDGYEYYNIRFRTPVTEAHVYRLNEEEMSRNIYVGERLSVVNDLYSHFWIDGLERTDTEYSSYFTYNEEDDSYTVLRSSNGDDVYINGYDRDGVLLVRYAIKIEEAE